MTLLLCLTLIAASPNAPVVLVEAESFAHLGGWVIDQQFMDQMGSPFLLAHGLGVPVRDATTSVAVPAPGVLSQIDRWRKMALRSQLLKTEHLVAAQFADTPRLAFAHSDWAGYSVFEEAFTLGHAAGLALA